MATITGFDTWLDQADLDSEGYTAVYALYCAVRGCTTMGQFTCKQAEVGERWLVTCTDAEDTLLLASEKSKEYFLAHLTKAYCRDMEMEGWYYYNHSMAKND